MPLQTKYYNLPYERYYVSFVVVVIFQERENIKMFSPRSNKQMEWTMNNKDNDQPGRKTTMIMMPEPPPQRHRQDRRNVRKSMQDLFVMRIPPQSLRRGEGTKHVPATCSYDDDDGKGATAVVQEGIDAGCAITVRKRTIAKAPSPSSLSLREDNLLGHFHGGMQAFWVMPTALRRRHRSRRTLSLSEEASCSIHFFRDDDKVPSAAIPIVVDEHIRTLPKDEAIEATAKTMIPTTTSAVVASVPIAAATVKRDRSVHSAQLLSTGEFFASTCASKSSRRHHPHRRHHRSEDDEGFTSSRKPTNFIIVASRHNHNHHNHSAVVSRSVHHDSIHNPRRQMDTALTFDAKQHDKDPDAAVWERLHQLFPNESWEFPADFPKFRVHEITLGKRLGRGSQSVVQEIARMDISGIVQDDTDHDGDGIEVDVQSQGRDLDTSDHSNRNHVSSRCLTELGESRYALKRLREDFGDDNKGRRSICDDRSCRGSSENGDSESLWTAMVDMLVETRILSLIDHPHILKLRGVAATRPLQPNYFLVVDRLYHTLVQRIGKWKAQEMSLNKLRFASLFSGGRQRQEQKQELWLERMAHACHLAQALDYLHKHRLIHRDIKPENIGFDLVRICFSFALAFTAGFSTLCFLLFLFSLQRDNIKIFDFGFARQLPPIEADEFFLLSGLTGTLRYMAPEVALNQPYNEKCDVYSFAILLWEMLTLQRPYASHCESAGSFCRKVFDEKKRPELPRKWPKTIRALMQGGWETNPSKRLDIETMLKRLEVELDHSFLLDTSRHSHMVFDHRLPNIPLVNVPKGVPFNKVILKVK